MQETVLCSATKGQARAMNDYTHLATLHVHVEIKVGVPLACTQTLTETRGDLFSNLRPTLRFPRNFLIRKDMKEINFVFQMSLCLSKK